MTHDDDEVQQSDFAQPESGGAGQRPPKEPDYDVGYGKPPKHSRFQKGQASPNPKGRPRKPKGFQAMLKEELAAKISVTVDGKTVKLPASRVIIRQLIRLAAKGHPGGVKEFVKLAKEMEPLAPEPPISEEELRERQEMANKLNGVLMRGLEAMERDKQSMSRRITKYQKRPAGADDDRGDGSPPLAPA